MEAPAGTRPLTLIKMHGAENEFIVIDERPARFDESEYPTLARRLCNGREFGLSADGMLVITSEPGEAVARMRIFNADGSEPEMCGNGVRCAARYLAERGAGDAFTIATLAGPIEANVLAREPSYLVRVDIGPVTFPHHAKPESLEARGTVWTYVMASLGNPHAVIYVDEVAAIDVGRDGRAISTHARFERGTNVHFVTLLGKDAIAVRHYERGVGITQACGTGAVASAAVTRQLHGYGTPLEVRVPGGRLRIDWEPGENARLTGPAEVVFERTVAV